MNLQNSVVSFDMLVFGQKSWFLEPSQLFLRKLNTYSLKAQGRAKVAL
jgi:hypothetical protein